MKRTHLQVFAIAFAVLAWPGCSARHPASRAPEAPAAGADAALATAPEAKKEEPFAAPPPPPAEPKSGSVTSQIDESDPARALAEAESLLDASLGPKRSGDRVGREGSLPPAKEEPAAESCSVACRALASMRRSADRLCQLAPSASPDATRCSDARDRVVKAEQRVREQCPSCAASP